MITLATTLCTIDDLQRNKTLQRDFCLTTICASGKRDFFMRVSLMRALVSETTISFGPGLRGLNQDDEFFNRRQQIIHSVNLSCAYVG